MNCNILTQSHAEHERAAAVWSRMSPLERALALVEHERMQRSIDLQLKRVHRALPMVKRPCAAKE